MSEEVRNASNTLLEAIHRTDIFQKSQQLKQNINEDPVNSLLLQRYEKCRSDLRMQSLGNNAPDQELVQEFNKLNTLVFSDEQISEYLIVQMQLEKMAVDIMSNILNECGLSFNS